MIALSGLMAHRKLIGIGLIALAFAAMWFTLARTRDKLETARAQVELVTAQRDELIRAGERRKAAAQKALAEAKPRIERVTTDIERIRAETPAEGKCETLDSIMSADL